MQRIEQYIVGSAGAKCAGCERRAVSGDWRLLDRVSWGSSNLLMMDWTGVSERGECN
jgi:hypothetical protein